jgi:predicted alpha-1,2-mannosidase
MMYQLMCCLLLFSLGLGCAGAPPEPSVDAFALVDPFIGTGGSGFGSANCHPGATLPYGMVQVGPDTTRSEGVNAFDHAAGYHFRDQQLLGFSHSRLSGVSTPDLGAVLVTPGTAEPQSLVSLKARTLAFSHADEYAEPGYYKVQLKTPSVLVEVAATTRAAHHRYRFAGGGPARLVVDVGYAITSIEVGAAHINFIAPNRFEGWVEHQGRFSSAAVGGLRTYFSAAVEPAPTNWGTFGGGQYADSVASREGKDVGAVLSFDASEVGMRLALSYVSVDGARANLEAELPEATAFDATRAAAATVWRAQLDRVRFTGGNAHTQKVLATALYRSAVAPNMHADVDGSYRGIDGKVRVAQAHRQHHFFSLWDTYRTVHPLVSLIDPERQRDLVRSLIQMGDDAGGALPLWTAGHASTSVTLGAPADIVLAESVLKGIDLPAGAALDLVLRSAEAPVPVGTLAPGREGVLSQVRRGYVAADEDSRSVSRTLEYAIADAAISRLAAQLGKSEIAAKFAARGRNYTTLFNPQTKVFRGRNADGVFVTPFDPLIYQERDLYYGGNAVQYAWLAPHDPVGLMALFGSATSAAEQLEAFFRRGRDEVENNALSGLLPISGYTQQNEHDIHAAYLFLAVGRPDLTQQWVQWIAETRYGTGPDGIPGNEDAGALSAWFVWAAMGLYPAPGQDWYFVGSPLVDRLELRRPEGKLVITRQGEGSSVQKVTLDGKVLEFPWLTHAQLAGDRTLAFQMGPTAGTWGRDFGNPSSVADARGP